MTSETILTVIFLTIIALVSYFLYKREIRELKKLKEKYNAEKDLSKIGEELAREGRVSRTTGKRRSWEGEAIQRGNGEIEDADSDTSRQGEFEGRELLPPTPPSRDDEDKRKPKRVNKLLKKFRRRK